MNRLLLILILFSLFYSCSDSNEDIDDTWIILSDFSPSPGSIITEATYIKAKIKYNISPNELEGMGFYLDHYIHLGEITEWSTWYGTSVGRTDLTVRNNEGQAYLDRIRPGQLDGKLDTVYYKSAIVRKTSETKGESLFQTKPVYFIIK